MQKIITAATLVAALGAATVAVAYGGATVCQYDNLEMHWDGRTKLINGNTYREYQCPNHHVTWVQQ